MDSVNDSVVVNLVERWIEQCVIDLSLCPFAGAPYRKKQVRMVVCSQASESAFLELLNSELNALLNNVVEIETTLVIAPHVLAEFYLFNEFLTQAEALLDVDDRQSQAQIASFHPQYQFAGVAADDAGNYTNRAPFPIVQWLRSDTVAKAVDTTNTLTIPERNINMLQAMSADSLASLFPWVQSIVHKENT